jgi:microsomal dipeptidase-like Zn-dependent dipeptidase
LTLFSQIRRADSVSELHSYLFRVCCRVPAGLEDVSKYPDLFDRLANSLPGEPTWSSEDLQKLAGLNLIRVLEEVEKVSHLYSTWFSSYLRTYIINR